MTRMIKMACMAMLCMACDYEESVDLCTLSVQLVYPENSIQPYAGARVELKSTGRDAIFVDSTNASGTVFFNVTPGIYEASTSSQFKDTLSAVWYNYHFNGVRSQIVVSPDSTNRASIELKMSRKRIVH